MATRNPLENRPLIVGMVHLPPLPGAPAAQADPGARRGTRPTWVRHAVREAETLVAAGFGAVLVENYGDAPFFKDRVPAETIAALTRAVSAVRDALPARVAVGVNVLRNDALAAMSVAAAAGLDFIRVNVLSGAVATDQGVIEGRAADLSRLRARLAPAVRFFAVVRVKHARPLAPRPLEQEVHDLVQRGGADAVIVSGDGTGLHVDADELAEVRAAAGAAAVLIGSGAAVENIARLLTSADGAIVGTSIKRGRHTTAPVDGRRARAFVRAATRA
jgi:membrane complex biogenesis BtpA family protein